MVTSIEASGAPVRRRGFEAQRAAFEHVLQLVDAMIALLQAPAAAESVGRAITHAQGPAAVHAARRVLDQPELLGPAAALRAAEIGPRPAVRECRMGDADQLVIPPERNDDLPVLQLDRACNSEARHARIGRSSKKMRLSASFLRFGLNRGLACATTGLVQARPDILSKQSGHGAICTSAMLRVATGRARPVTAGEEGAPPIRPCYDRTR